MLTFVNFALALPAFYNDPSGYPQDWPDNMWVPYTYLSEPINDSVNDSNPSSIDAISYVGADDLASIYYYADGKNLFVRWSLAGAPLKKGSGLPYVEYTWHVLIDIDGDGYKEFFITLDGKDGGNQLDDIEVFYSDSNSQSVDNSDIIWRQDSAINWSNPSPGVDGESGKTDDWDKNSNSDIWDFGRTRVTRSLHPDIGEFYFLDLQIPFEALDASQRGGYKFTDSTRFGMAFSTSTNNTDPLNKDFIYEGDYIATSDSPLPFGDNSTVYGETIQKPFFSWVDITDCGPNTEINAAVVDTVILDSTTGELKSSVDKVDFYYYYDRNDNGLADDGSSWMHIGEGALDGALNPWNAYWDTTSIFIGHYLIKGIAFDNQGNSMDSYTQYENGESREIAILNNSCGIEPPSISGTVFEDYDDKGNNFNNNEDFLKSSVNLRLYRETDGVDNFSTGDSYVGSAETDINGEFSFENIVSGVYYIVVDSKSVKPQSLNSGYTDKDTWVEQTYVREYTDGTYIESNKFGGEDPSISDGFNQNSTEVSENHYEHIAKVEVDNTDVNGIDFGFSFNVIVNENDTGDNTQQKIGNQGTLRQFILNANAIEGANKSRFVMMTPPNETSGENSWWKITLQGLLPTLKDDDIAINGTVWNSNNEIVNTNKNSISNIFTGINDTLLDPFLGKEIEVDVNGLNHGIQINGALRTELRNIAFFNGGGNVFDESALIKVMDDSNYLTLADILLGTRADFTQPIGEMLNKSIGVYVKGSRSVNINHLYIANSVYGIFAEGNTKELSITNSVISENSKETVSQNGNGITLLNLGTASNVTLKKLFIENNGGNQYSYETGNGLLIKGTSDGLIENITVKNSASSGISFIGSHSFTISEALCIESRNGPGIRVGKHSSYLNISNSAFEGNAGVAIDLITRERPNNYLNDGINPNDSLINDENSSTGEFGNLGIDHPIITSLNLSNGQLTIEGYIGENSPSEVFAGSRVEFYIAESGQGDYLYNDGLGDERLNPDEPLELTSGPSSGEGSKYLGFLIADENGGFNGTLSVGTDSFGIVTAVTIFDHGNGESSTSEFGPNKGFTYSVSGKIFEDTGSNGSEYATEDILKSNVEVRLYRESDSNGYLSENDVFLNESITTDGTYSFDVESGVYYIVVDSKSVKPDSLNSGYTDNDVWAEQTYVSEYVGGTYVESNKFGGKGPSVSDDFNLNSTEVSENHYEHIAKVEINNEDINNIDFGFSFNVIVNENDTGDNSQQQNGNQGTLRQFILNANAISGANKSRFVMMTPPNETSGENSWWKITLQGLLVEIIDTETEINCEVFDFENNINNTNNAFFGDTTVGKNDVALSGFQGNEIEIDTNKLSYAIKSSAENFVLRNCTFLNGGGNIEDEFAPVIVINNAFIENTTSGIHADGTKPASEYHNNRFGIIAKGISELSHVYIGYSGSGLLVETLDSTLSQLYIKNNAVGSASTDGNGIEFRNAKSLLVNSLISATGENTADYKSGNGVYFNNSADVVINESTIETSAAANLSFSNSSNNFVSNCTIINSLSGPGIRVGMSSNNNYFSKNVYFGNYKMAIDLVDSETLLFDGPTSNDSATSTTANEGIDKPIITGSIADGSIVNIEGYVGLNSGSSVFSGATVEFYEASPGNGDTFNDTGYGEGSGYLGYCTTDVNGNFNTIIDIGTKKIEKITAITLHENNTSEFGPNISISGGYKISGFLFEDDNFNRVKDPSEMGIENVRIELWKKDGDSWSELKSVLTDTEGNFSFDAITGTYRIVEDDGNNYNSPFSGSDPAGYISTTPNSVERVITNNNIMLILGIFRDLK
ncbi:MAG: hypothetical protein FXF54_02405 [Kosmotoga sp.]|nr:MAG: hypothetical protein FXF54_02405 [Kosmotoga sp.]